MENNEKQFVEGFNNGYLLAKHEPVLAGKILKTIEPSNEYLSGLIAGQNEYEIEFLQIQLDEMNSLRNRSPEHSRDHEQEQ